jgi:hypothetical protein
LSDIVYEKVFFPFLIKDICQGKKYRTQNAKIPSENRTPDGYCPVAEDKKIENSCQDYNGGTVFRVPISVLSTGRKKIIFFKIFHFFHDLGGTSPSTKNTCPRQI